MENTCGKEAQLANAKGKTGLQKTLDLELIIEGWVERSDTHQLLVNHVAMGIAALHPSFYALVICRVTLR